MSLRTLAFAAFVVGAQGLRSTIRPVLSPRQLSGLRRFAVKEYATMSEGRLPEALASATTPNNADAVAGLSPQLVWSSFAAIASVPRPSKKEERIIALMKAFADERSDVEFLQDAVGNVLLKRPGQNGGEGAAPVVLQGHLDMVTEKNADTTHDFDEDPISFEHRGEWLGAKGTTLGADNGLGVAAILGVLCEESCPLPPIEALLTVDEETGLTGAFGLDGSLLSGRVLLNLDTEEHGALYVGCAGGGDSIMTVGLSREAAPEASESLRITVDGLLGGHSGINIHEGRGNALQIAALAAQRALRAAPSARLVSVSGGDKRNAIPREASALISFAEEDRGALEAAVAAQDEDARLEYGHLDKDVRVALSGPGEETGPAGQVLDGASAERLLSVLLAIPHGALKKSAAVEDLVETSNNLASCSMSGQSGGARIVLSTRSSIAAGLEAAREKLRAVAALSGAEIELQEAYPGWNPNLKSVILEKTKAAMRRVIGAEPRVLAIHAGLEAGLIADKVPGMDCVSFGPTIRGAHSPDEEVLVETVAPFYETVLETLKDLAAPSQ